MISVSIGLIFMAAGIWGMAVWKNDVLTLIKGLLPILGFGGGAMAALAGISGIRDRILDTEKEK